MKKEVLSVLGSGLLMLAPAPVTAVTTVYTDSALFRADLGVFTVYGFDSFSLTEGPDIAGYFQTLDRQIPGIDFDNARVNLGAFAGTSNSPPNVVLNADMINPIVMRFSQPQVGVGLFNTSIVDAELFEVFDQNGAMIGSIRLPDRVVNFGGFISDQGIYTAVITPAAPTNGSIYIDDLTVTAVPIPAALLLLGSGLAVLVTARFRRTRAAAKAES